MEMATFEDFITIPRRKADSTIGSRRQRPTPHAFFNDLIHYRRGHTAATPLRSAAFGK
jgi:hypothetical protein